MDEIMKAKADASKYNDGLVLNYVADGELTVLITLGEYRALVADSAILASVRAAKYAAETNAEKLAKDVESLRAELESIRKAVNAEC